MACMGTAAELTRVDGVAAAAAAVLTWLDGACAAAGLAGARGPQKSHSFLFPLIQAHLIQKICSLKKRHRVPPKIFHVPHLRHRVPHDALVCLKTFIKRHERLKKPRVALKRNTGVCVCVCLCVCVCVCVCAYL